MTADFVAASRVVRTGIAKRATALGAGLGIRHRDRVPPLNVRKVRIAGRDLPGKTDRGCQRYTLLLCRVCAVKIGTPCFALLPHARATRGAKLGWALADMACTQGRDRPLRAASARHGHA